MDSRKTRAFIEQLPDDVLLHIMSFLPSLADRCRTSILSCRWRYLWRNILDFDPFAVLHSEDPRLYGNHDWFISWVDSVIDQPNRPAAAAAADFPLVKHLILRYHELDEKHSGHIRRWINFAIANRVETLHLQFGTVHSKKQFILSEDLWSSAVGGLSSIKSLKSLSLWSVNVTEQFVHFILSSCPLLEDLSLRSTGDLTRLHVSHLRLRLFHIRTLQHFALTLCAPQLISLHLTSLTFTPQVIHVPMLIDMNVGGHAKSSPINEYLEPFWNYMPQLEKLQLQMFLRQDFKFKQLPELVKLRYLKIQVIWDTTRILFEIIKFIKVFSRPNIPSRPQLEPGERKIKQKWYRELEEKCVFESLNELELYGAGNNTMDLQVVECIISKSPNLKKLTVDTRNRITHCSEPEVVEVVKAKANLLCHQEIDIKVI